MIRSHFLTILSNAESIFFLSLQVWDCDCGVTHGGCSSPKADHTQVAEVQLSAVEVNPRKSPHSCCQGGDFQESTSHQRLCWWQLSGTCQDFLIQDNIIFNPGIIRKTAYTQGIQAKLKYCLETYAHSFVQGAQICGWTILCGPLPEVKAWCLCGPCPPQAPAWDAALSIL